MNNVEKFKQAANSFHDASVRFLETALATFEPGTPEYEAALKSLNDLNKQGKL